MVAVSMNVSTRLGATAVSAGVDLCCMRTNMTVKKVFHPEFLYFFCLQRALVRCCSILTWYGSLYWLSDVFLQLAVITRWIVSVARSPAPIGRINTPARRHAPGYSPPLRATASKLYVPLPPAHCIISLVNHAFVNVLLIIELLNPLRTSVFTALMSEAVRPTMMCGSLFCYLRLCRRCPWETQDRCKS